MPQPREHGPRGPGGEVMSTISVTDYLNSTYDTSSSSSSSSSSSDYQDMFLTMLCTELENQDPLDPVDDTEMVAQLAQISTLEQLATMNENMESMVTLLQNQEIIQASSYLGKEVTAEGSDISKDGDSISIVTYTLGEDAASLYAHVMDEDGNILASVDLGSQDAGTHTFQWDGLDADGDELADGTYTIAFTAADADGDSLVVSMSVSGTVNSVSIEDGNIILGLSDGREVNLFNVSTVVDSSVSTSSN